MVPNRDNVLSANVAAAVRAEIARRQMRSSELGGVIGLGRNAAYGRLRGETPFDMEELAAIAKWLGIDVQIIFENNALGIDVQVAA